MAIKIILICIFFALTATIGIVSRKRVNDVSSFVLGGRGIGPWLAGFSYGTTYFSAVIFVGYAGQFGWNFGVAATWIGIANALIGGLLAWKILARRTRTMTHHLNTTTMPEFFNKRYHSPALKNVASIIIFIFLVPYTSSVYKGLSQFFEMTFHIDFVYCVIGMGILAAIYVVLGGYLAAALNDFIQGTIMIVGIIMVVWAVLAGKGGFSEAIRQLSQVPDTNGNTGSLTSLFGPDPLALLGVVLMTSLGAWGLPQMVHKFYVIKDDRSVKIGTIISTVFCLIIAGGSYFMGSFGRLYYTSGEGGVVYDTIVPSMLSQRLTDLMIGVVLILVLSASLSTLSSLVITSSSTVVLDLLNPNLLKLKSDKQKVLVVRLFCFVFLVLSVVIALFPNTLITTLMSLSWGAIAGSMLGPFLYGLYWKKTTVASVWASFILGVGFVVANFFGGWLAPTLASAAAILASLVIVPAVSLLSGKLPKDHIDRVFSCYKQ